MPVEHLRVAELFHDCDHRFRVHKCTCGLGDSHSDAEWDEWYAAKENG